MLEDYSEIKRYVLKQFPDEAIVVKTHNGLNFLKNVSPCPTIQFKISDEDAMRMYEEGIEWVIHSHTKPLSQSINYDIRTPSKQDMEQQSIMNVPWGIIGTEGECTTEVLWFGDSIEKPPLLGRLFIHGVQDCYSIIRDWYWFERNIWLNDYPRGVGWWEGDNPEHMYEDNFGKEGFVEVEHGKGVEVGDVLLMSILCKTLNHAAVYVGDNKIIHHVMGKLSTEDSYTRWSKRIEKVLRRV